MQFFDIPVIDLLESDGPGHVSFSVAERAFWIVDILVQSSDMLVHVQGPETVSDKSVAS